MPRAQEPKDAISTAATLASIVLVIAILYFAQEVLLPIAVAVLLAFVLTPLTIWLERRRLGRVPSVLLSVALAFVVLGGIGWIVTAQLVDLAQDVPRYQNNLTERIRGLRSMPVGGGVFTRLSETVQELGQELTGEPAKPAEEAQAPVRRSADPVPVRLVESSPFAVRILRDWLGPLLAPLGTAALVIIFVIFILLSREDLRNRLIRLAGTGRVYVTTQAFDEAGARISRYLLMQLIINVTYGLAVAVGLWFIGVPSAFLWGLLATVMRFVPYVGPWIAAILPIGLSLAVFDGWTRPLATVGWFLVLELVSNNVMEPWLYGTQTGLSTIGIMASAVFWTWLWGPLGLVLSTPLTVCLTVLGRHVPRLGFLNVLLSDEPALQADIRFYQRLLAFDYNEASDLAAQFLKANTLDELYERVFIPALSLAERDRHNGLLNQDQARFMYGSIDDLRLELQQQFDTSAASETVPRGAAEDAAAQDQDEASRARRALHVLCVPAEDEADRLAGDLLAQLLDARGHVAATASLRAVDPGLHQVVREHDTDCVVISALAPGGAIHARDGARRLRAAFPRLTIVIGLWNAGGSLEGTRERLSAAGANTVTTRLSEGLEEIQRFAPSPETSTRSTDGVLTPA